MENVKPSYLPTKALLELPRNPQMKLLGIHIELVHIVIFALILVFLFAHMWKKPHRHD